MRGEILGLERRRRWSDEEKLSIVLSVGVNGATVSQVAHRHEIRCHCTLFNQILRIQLILGRFCTLNYNISTGFTPQDLTPSELFQIASARVRSASRFAPAPSSDMA